MEISISSGKSVWGKGVSGKGVQGKGVSGKGVWGKGVWGKCVWEKVFGVNLSECVLTGVTPEVNLRECVSGCLDRCYSRGESQ